MTKRRSEQQTVDDTENNELTKKNKSETPASIEGGGGVYNPLSSTPYNFNTLSSLSLSSSSSSSSSDALPLVSLSSALGGGNIGSASSSSSNLSSSQAPTLVPLPTPLLQGGESTTAPATASSSALVALNSYRAKDYVKAIEHGKEAMRLDPSNALHHGNLAQAFYMTKNYVEAIEHFKEAMRLDPGKAVYTKNLAAAHNNLARACYVAKDYVEAIEHGKEAMRLDPSNALAHGNLGTTYYMTKDYVKAIEHGKEAMRLDPSNPLAHGNLAQAFHMTKDYVKAVEHGKEAIRLDSNNTVYTKNLATSHNWSGVDFTEKGEYVKSIEHFKEAMRLDPSKALYTQNLAAAFSGLSTACYGAKNYDKAVEHGKEALRLDPSEALYTKKLAEAHNKLAVAFHVAQDYAKAIEHGKEAMRLNPGQDWQELYTTNLAVAHMRLAEAFYKAKDYVKAIEHGKEAISSFKIAQTLNLSDPQFVRPQDFALVHKNLGLALLQRKSLDGEALPEAIIQYEEAIKAENTPANRLNLIYAHNEAGNFCLNQKDHPSAIVHYKKAAALTGIAEVPETILSLQTAIVASIDANRAVVDSVEFHQRLEKTQYNTLSQMLAIQLAQLNTMAPGDETNLNNQHHAIGENFFKLSCHTILNKKAFIQKSIRHFEKSGTITSLTKILEIDPEGVFVPKEKTLSRIGELYFVQGKFTEALACFKKCLALNPDNLDTHLNLSKIYNELYAPKLSIEHYTKATSYFPKLLEVLKEAIDTKIVITEIIEYYTGDSDWLNEQSINLVGIE